MKQFLILYTGRVPKLTELPGDQATTELDNWNQWGINIGDALVSNGMPVVDQTELVDNGAHSRPVRLRGYAVIQAETMDQALEIVKTHPHLAGTEKEGQRGIAVYELMTEPLANYAQHQPTVAPPEPAPTEADVPPSTPLPGATLPPPVDEEAVPPAAPGELTIPHETPTDEQPPTPPTPGQPAS